LFLLVEHRAGAAALVSLELFRSARFCGAVAATASMTFGIYGMIFLLPLAWQTCGLLQSRGAGLALLPFARENGRPPRAPSNDARGIASAWN
jgi:DHA2 family methylenomycin A resistance protein-like MFS transporter